MVELLEWKPCGTTKILDNSPTHQQHGFSHKENHIRNEDTDCYLFLRRKATNLTVLFITFACDIIWEGDKPWTTWAALLEIYGASYLALCCWHFWQGHVLAMAWWQSTTTMHFSWWWCTNGMPFSRTIKKFQHVGKKNGVEWKFAEQFLNYFDVNSNYVGKALSHFMNNNFLTLWTTRVKMNKLFYCSSVCNRASFGVSDGSFMHVTFYGF